MFRGIDRLVLRVPNLTSAVSYYRDVLGLRLIHEHRNVAILGFGHAPSELVLHCDPGEPEVQTFLLVDDVRWLYERREQLKLTFTSPPARTARGYKATVKDPFGIVLNLLDRTTAVGSNSSHDNEDTRPPGSLFAGVNYKTPANNDLLIKLYTTLGRTADDLPYTPHFESLYEPYIADFQEPKPDRAEVWRHLLNLRKRARLPKLGEARSGAPEISPEQRQNLRELIGNDIGKRDRLPYTPRFEQIVEQFNATLPRKISPHLIWRLVATLAK